MKNTNPIQLTRADIAQIHYCKSMELADKARNYARATAQLLPTAHEAAFRSPSKEMDELIMDLIELIKATAQEAAKCSRSAAGASDCEWNAIEAIHAGDMEAMNDEADAAKSHHEEAEDAHDEALKHWEQAAKLAWEIETWDVFF